MFRRFQRLQTLDIKNLDQDEKIPAFLENATCKAIASKYLKAVLISTKLSVKDALDNLIMNKIRAALLVDPASNEFIGMLTISDFINVFRYYNNNPQEDIGDIKRKKIRDLTGITTVIKPVVTIPEGESLFNAARLLVEEKIHRIPVTSGPTKCKFLASKKRILRHLHNNLFKTDKELPFVMKRKIAHLKPDLGTWENIATVTLKTRVTEALDLFCERRVSALPIVNENGQVTDVFAKFDVIIAAKDQMHKMNMTVAEALKRVRGKAHEGLFMCKLNENLLTVVDRFVVFKVHRLVVVNKNNSVIGMISLSDVLKLLSRPRLENHEIIPDLLRLSMCRVLQPDSSHIVTMTPSIWATYCFKQLAGFNVRSALLVTREGYIGMITISDFINVLRHWYTHGEPVEGIHELQIIEFRSIMHMENEFVAIHPKDSFFNAAELLIQNKIHRLPVADGMCVFLLSKRKILKYLYDQLSERNKQRAFQRKRVADLKQHLGTWNNIATVTLETGIPDAVNLFCDRQVSSLPVVDENGKLIEIFAKSDILALVLNGTYSNRHLIVANALNQGWERHEELRTCKLDSLLRDIFQIFANEKVHRLVVVDNTPSVIGIISTSDILKFLIRMPSESGIVEEAVEAAEALEGAVGGAVLG